MRHLLLLAALLLAGASRATAQVAPANTLPGQTALARSLSATMCAELSGPGATSLHELPAAEVVPYAQKLFGRAMQHDSARVAALLAAASARHISPTQAKLALGRETMTCLGGTCPAARPLALRLSHTTQGQQAIAAHQPQLAPAERQVLLPIARDLCAGLAASTARTPFSQLSPAGRKQVFISAMTKAFQPHLSALTRFYGPARLAELRENGQLDSRIAGLMMAQGTCGDYLLLIGQDRLAGRNER